jgi:predicted phosphodiesterase
VRIGLLSDTHGIVDDAVFTYFAECDEIWHAGDFGDIATLRALDSRKPVRGVYGNVDDDLLRAELPLDLEWDCEGVPVYMTHIGGRPGRYDPRAKAELLRRKPALFICGHSHVLKVARDDALGLLYMNPGAAGYQGWHVVRTMLRFTISGGRISALEAVELGPRSRQSNREVFDPR